MEYTDLLIESDNLNLGLLTKEKPLSANDGRIRGNRIAIRSGLTDVEKKCVLAEELGHYYTSCGNITNQSAITNRKQEVRARLWAYNKTIGLYGIISAYLHGCHSLFEIADYLEVTEAFAREAIENYKSKYGKSVPFDNYMIFFEPLSVLELYK